MEEVSTGAVDHLYHVISVSNDDNDNNKLVSMIMLRTMLVLLLPGNHTS